MKIVPGETYIEKRKYFSDCVVVARRVTDEYVYVKKWWLDTMQVSRTTFTIDSFKRRFEKSWLKMRMNRRSKTCKKS